MFPDQYPIESGKPSGVSHVNGCCPTVATCPSSVGIPAAVTDGESARRPDMMRWEGRLNLAGAARTLLGDSTSRSIDLTSPAVLVYTCATAETCAGVGS